MDVVNELDILEKQLYDRLVKYVNDGLKKKRICCVKHRWALFRFKKFIKDKRYWFDKKELLSFYVWCTQFTHRVGVLAGTPFYLSDYHLWLTANILCIKHRDTGYRKTVMVYVQVGRKNGKSQFMAGLVTYFAFLSKEQQDIYLSGWDKSGSAIVYKEILHQINSSRALQSKFSTSYGKILVKKNGSEIIPLSKEAKNNDNANNPSLAIVDEYKDHKTSEILENLTTGTVGRAESLIVIITTAGDNLNCPCKNTYDTVTKILDPDVDVEDDSYFIDIHELDKGDSIDDESNWIKANPVMTSYDVGMKNLRKLYRLSKLSYDKLRTFLTKNMNIWVDMADDGYMDMGKWNSCGVKEFDYSVFSKAKKIYLGVDLSAKIDLSSIVFGCEYDGKYYFMQRSFLPKIRYEELLNLGENQWYRWYKQGYLKLIEGETIDIFFIIDVIESMVVEFEMELPEIDYDSWSATQFAIEMTNRGYETVEIRQGIRTLGEGTARFREEVYKGNVIHENDGLYGFAFSNAVLREDANKNFMIDKKKSKNKIDPAVATMNICSRIFNDDSVDYDDIFESFMEAVGGD